MNATDFPAPSEALQNLGLTTELWSKYMRRLQDDVQSKQVGPCAEATASFLTCYLSMCVCNYHSNSKSYHQALRAWQEDFNAELTKFNMFCKTQSYVYGFMVYNPNTHTVVRSELVSSWLAVAVGDAAIAKLRAKPHLQYEGIPRHQGKASCTCCCKQVSTSEDWVM